MELKKRFKLYKSGKMWCCAAVAFGALAFGTVNGQADDNTPASSPVTTAQVATTSQSSTTATTDSNNVSSATTNAATNTATTAAATNSATAQTSSQSQVPVTTASATTETTHAATNNGIGTINTLDISAYQPNISAGTFAQYHNQGINNVIVKLSEGSTWVNTYAQNQVNNAKQAGMNVAAYHFVRFTTASEAQAEAQLFARMARGIGLGSDTLMIADVEQVPQTQYAGIVNNLNVFWQTLDSLGFTNHGVYTGYSYDHQYNVSSTVGKNRTWVAAYGNYRNLVQSQGYGAWQYTDNWNGTHIDASIDLGMFASYMGGITRAANLDGVTIDSANNTLNVSGWFADDNNQGKNNRYVILLDANNNDTELARTQVSAVTRNDVSNAYPDIYGAGNSGFNATFQISGNLANAIAAGHQIKVLVRNTSSADGNSDYNDNTFDAVAFNKNVASLDSMSLTNNGIEVSGWQAADQSISRSNRYVILYDATTHREIERQSVSSISRPDVQRANRDVYGSQNSGFQATFAMNDALRNAIQNGDSLQVISRYTNDPAGNGDSIDYWFAAKSFNQNQGAVDSFTLNNGHLQVSGWHASDKSGVDPYQWIILIDNQTGKEVARVRANTVSRPDVARVYPGILNSSNSGFNADFDIAQFASLRNALLQGHSLKVIARYSDNSQSGEGKNNDYWFNTPKTFNQFNDNYGNLDGMIRTSNGIHVAGWHVTNQSIARPNHYVILYDATQGREIARQQVTTTQRLDVQRVHPSDYNSDVSGFDTIFSTANTAVRNALVNHHSLRVIDRYTSSQDGNSDYIDYWFPARTL